MVLLVLSFIDRCALHWGLMALWVVGFVPGNNGLASLFPLFLSIAESWRLGMLRLYSSGCLARWTRISGLGHRFNLPFWNLVLRIEPDNWPIQTKLLSAA
jgi:hypothetical protein